MVLFLLYKFQKQTKIAYNVRSEIAMILGRCGQWVVKEQGHEVGYENPDNVMLFDQGLITHLF